MTYYEPVIDAADVENLRASFRFFDHDQDGLVSVEDLQQTLVGTLQKPASEEQLLVLINEVRADPQAGESFDIYDFLSYMLSKRVDNVNNLETAFSALHGTAESGLTQAQFRAGVKGFGLSENEADDIFRAVDAAGEGRLDFDAFCRPVHDYYRATRAAPESSPQAPVAAELPLAEAAPLRSAAEQAQAGVTGPSKDRGTSVLQLQVGFFRLLQGAAYRCFRASFSANHGTHLPVRNLPYRISDFVDFVDTTIEFYKQLGVVTAECHPVLDALTASIRAEYLRLTDRVRHWPSIEKTPEMLHEAISIRAQALAADHHKARYVAVVQEILATQKHALEFIDIVNEVLARDELHRLRNRENRGPSTPAPADEDPRSYLNAWNRVILHHADEAIEGAMMPVSYWYEDFMPKLLAAFSVSTGADIPDNTMPNEPSLRQWYLDATAAGEFSRHGTYIPLVFDTASPGEKLRFRQSWRLCRHYLNGVQKRRERAEFGRDNGVLSQYVAFMDIYLGRTFVRDADMRLSFPYYIGPAVWRSLHTAAEIIAGQPPDEQTKSLPRFTSFFVLFASLYPCPYCRHHLNAYVVQNKEIDMYPLEYILLGLQPGSVEFRVTMSNKLATVVDGASLRLFLWKLHNTVSSSISRSEEWYRQDESAFYTTRYWPSIESDLERAQARRQYSLDTDRVGKLYKLFKPLSRLSFLRFQLQAQLANLDAGSLAGILQRAGEHIRALEDSVIDGEFLQSQYGFQPELVDDAPEFSAEEEAYARSAAYIAT